MKNSAVRGRILSVTGLSLVLAVYGLPLVYMVATSLKNRPDIFAAPASLFFTPTLQAYRALWGPELVQAALNSAIIAFGTAILVLVLASPAAYWLARGRGSLITVGLASLILLQMVPQASTVIPLFRILAGWGLLGGLQAVILADSALLLPFAVILLRPFFASVPQSLMEAAEVDGAGQWTRFSNVAFPLARNGAVTVFLIIWIIAWGEFLYAITFLTSERRRPLSALLGGQITQFGIEWDRLMAMAVLVALPVLIVFAFSERRLAEGLTLGAGK